MKYLKILVCIILVLSIPANTLAIDSKDEHNFYTDNNKYRYGESITFTFVNEYETIEDAYLYIVDKDNNNKTLIHPLVPQCTILPPLRCPQYVSPILMIEYGTTYTYVWDSHILTSGTYRALIEWNSNSKYTKNFEIKNQKSEK